MVKTGVMGTGIDNIRKAHLRNTPQSLEIFMLHQIKNQFAGDGNKTIDGVVYNFMLWEGFQTLTLN